MCRYSKAAQNGPGCIPIVTPPLLSRGSLVRVLHGEAVGENQYIPLDGSYDDGTFLGFFRVIAGSHVDLTDT